MEFIRRYWHKATPETGPTAKNQLADKLTELGFRLKTEPLCDDAGKPIEVVGTVLAKSIEDVRRIVQAAKELGFGAMTIGSKTSAVGAFKGKANAKLHGLNGWLGIEIGTSGQLSDHELGEAKRSQYEVIKALDGRVRILKSKDPSKPNRVQAWAGLTPNEIDRALVQVLGPGHTIYMDLTTRGQAQIGAVVATGGQGPVRQNAAFNLHGLACVDGDGMIQHLEEEEAKKQVGLNGLAGAISEVDFEVIREEPKEFGVFIPIPGNLRAGFAERLPKIMAKLAPYTKGVFEDDPNGKMLRGAADPDVRVKGFEIVTLRDMDRTHDRMSQSAAKGMAGAINEFMRNNSCKTGLMINCRTHLSKQELKQRLNQLYEEKPAACGAFFEDLIELRRAGEIHPDQYSIYGVEEDDMDRFREVREFVAISARESRYEGPTKSTDLNLEITSSNPEEIEKAYRLVWDVYLKYIDDMSLQKADISIYGHAHPGSGNGSGGVDAHIRVSFPLERQDLQHRAAERLVYLDARQKKLYAALLALNGQYGIYVRPGEKGIPLNAEYTRWLEENDPEKADEIWQYMQRYGGKTFAARCPDSFLMHSKPPRLNDGLLNYFAPDPQVPEDAPILERMAKSIVLWCQNSHRSAEGKKVFGEVLGLLRDFLKLELNERIYYMESSEKAVHSAIVSLTDFANGEKTFDLRGKTETAELPDSAGTIILDHPELLYDPRLQFRKKILVVNHAEPVSKEIRGKADAVVYSAEAFGTGGEMGVMVTSTRTVRHARRMAENENNIGYVHALPELEKVPHSSIETPKMQVIAELGCMLAARAGQTSTLGNETAAKKLERQEKFITFNPGPSPTFPDIAEQSVELTNAARQFERDPTACRSRVIEIKDKLKAYLGIPQDYELFFSGSATQCMEQIVESLGLDNTIVLNMGAFGDRMLTVAQKFSSGHVSSNQMRWGSSVNSRLDSITGEIQRLQPEIMRDISLDSEKVDFNPLAMELDQKKGLSCAICITGHETSTGAQNNTSRLSERLDRKILRIVDGTSEVGGVERRFRNEEGKEDIDVYFGSFQKCFGVPAGLAFMAVSPRAMKQASRHAQKRAHGIGSKTPAYRAFVNMRQEAEEGRFHNLRGLLQLETVLDEFIRRGGISKVSGDIRAKLAEVTDEVDANPHLMHVVEDPVDRSEVMAHILATNRDMNSVIGLIDDEHEQTVGEGYGAPNNGETMRTYMSPHLPLAESKRLKESLHKAAEKAPEANVNRPVVARKLEGPKARQSSGPERLSYKVRRALAAWLLKGINGNGVH